MQVRIVEKHNNLFHKSRDQRTKGEINCNCVCAINRKNYCSCQKGTPSLNSSPGISCFFAFQRILLIGREICTLFLLGQFLISFPLIRDNIHLNSSGFVEPVNLFQCILNLLCVLREYAKKNLLSSGNASYVVKGTWRLHMEILDWFYLYEVVSEKIFKLN